jgi:hypothetical protein
MLILRVLQGSLVAIGAFGIWLAFRYLNEKGRTAQVVLVATVAVIALVSTQIMPLV